MNLEQNEFLNKHLPGRTPQENKALAPVLRKVTSAEKALARIIGARPATAQGRSAKLHRAIKARQEIHHLEDVVIEMAKHLAAERARLLPVDAESITYPNRAADDHSEDRYKVHAIGPSGSVYLGGCPSLGDGMARQSWFELQLRDRSAK